MFPTIQHHGREKTHLATENFLTNSSSTFYFLLFESSLFFLVALSSLWFRVVPRQLCSPNTITGIDVTVTSPAPAEVSETPWIRVRPSPSSSSPTAEQKRNNAAGQAGRVGGRTSRGELQGGGRSGGGIFLAPVTQLKRRSTNKRILCPKWLPC